MSISWQPKETEEEAEGEAEQETEEPEETEAPDKEAEEDTTKIDKGHFKTKEPFT